MNQYILYFKTWYEQRKSREKLLVLALVFALIYALFYFLLFRPLDIQKAILLNDIKTADNQINTWQSQIGVLKKIPETPLYQNWLKHQQSSRQLQGQYEFILRASPTKQWENAIKTILQAQDNVTLVEIKNLPAVAYNAANIYQQKLTVVVNSHFFATIDYLQRLEKQLPHLHWESIHYQVTQYPLANIQMEFSIIYAQN